ncbi:MAG: LysR family transcriptional regulator [Pseudomonadota bacterium]
MTIVREGSLRSAARALGVGASAVSLQLKALEESMGVGLLHRTTRNMELTDAGRLLFESVAPAYREINDAVKKTRAFGQSTYGTLRLSLSRGAYITTVRPILEAFQEAYPGIRLELSLNENLVDIVREGFHAGIRVGDLLTPDMVAVRITPPLIPAFSATPGYLKKYGRPEHPRDLLGHWTIRYKLPTTKKIAAWPFTEDGQKKTIDPPTRLVFDHIVGVADAIRGGLGVGWTLRATVDEFVRTGQLETILDPFAGELPPFYLYYPEQNKQVECLRLFKEYLVSNRKALATK